MGVMGGEDNTMKQKRLELFAWSGVPVFTWLSDLTTEEVRIRVEVSFFVWIVGCYVVQAFYTAMEITAGESGLTGVEGWKPLLGSLRVCQAVLGVGGPFWLPGAFKFESVVLHASQRKHSGRAMRTGFGALGSEDGIESVKQTIEAVCNDVHCRPPGSKGTLSKENIFSWAPPSTPPRNRTITLS
jgi:hypothetical protein